MEQSTATFIGVDLGDRNSQVCMLGEDGEVMEETRLTTNSAAFHRYFSRLDPAVVALEVGAHSRWSSALLEGLGHDVVVANPRRVELITKNHRKSDRIDAELLARLARSDRQLLSPVQHRSEDCQRILAMIRARDALVRARTQLINHARGTVKAAGERLRRCSTESFHKLEVPESRKQALEPMFQALATLTAQVKAYDRQIAAACESEYEDAQRLTQVAGVGPVTALAFVTTLEDPQRFAQSRRVGPFLGLVPRRDQSSGNDPELRISKTGDPYLRRLLVTAAHYIIGPFGPDSDLRRWGLELAERGGKNAKKRAVVAVARRLAVLLLTLWKSGAEYEPLRHAKERGTVGKTYELRSAG